VQVADMLKYLVCFTSP